ncbi:MAG: hypothetical protein DMD35_13315 [Gemmatimonadetes bacterium]|nr:MAG: hypothetical protein DMD35_13315 [Gemmatimonadota bacterium]
MKHSLIRALAASALLVVASATGANAQSATQSGSVASTASSNWAAVPTGVYKLLIQLPEQPLPATITVKDSSGVAVATFQTGEDPETHPVKVTVKGAELYVNGDAPKGPFEIVLTRQGADITGKWSYAGDTGKLTGKAE